MHSGRRAVGIDGRPRQCAAKCMSKNEQDSDEWHKCQKICG